MKDGKFKELIRTCYNKRDTNNLTMLLYGAISTTSVYDITDIDGYLNSCADDMLYLSSRIDRTEVDVYSYDLENYHVDELGKIIFIKLKNKDWITIRY